MKFVIEPHNPKWLSQFAEVQKQLQEILKDVPIIAIEHVGSTSIPSLPAKPILDIDIIVSSSSLDLARSSMTRAGYLDAGELDVPDRWVFRQPANDHLREADREIGVLKRHTYVCVEGCLSLRNHLDLKRVLLQDEGLRKEYGNVKLELAEKEFVDMDEYCRGKNEVMLKILRKGGWSEEELEEVRKANL
jgi:GrpB-like predicted nucleotidyltransferase (UPF0157 family)